MKPLNVYFTYTDRSGVIHTSACIRIPHGLTNDPGAIKEYIRHHKVFCLFVADARRQRQLV